MDHDQASPLALVTCGLLRADARLASLDGVVALFTQYLDVSSLISLPEAASKGSVRLFDCVATRVLADTTNNKAHVAFWFARALQAALEKDDLAILKRIHAFHPAPLYVYAPVTPPVLCASSLGVALKYCTLETVQWLIENRADRACCSPGARNFCRGCVVEATRSFGDRDAFRIIVWLFESGILSKASPKGAGQALWRPMQLSSQLVRWAADQQLLPQETALRLMYSVIRQSRADDAMELLDLISVPMPAASARCLLMLASFHGLSDVAEKLISLGHCREFQHKFVFALSAPGAAKLVQWGREFMDEHEPDHEPTAAWICCETASRCGNLAALQWLFHERGIPPNPSQLVSDVDDESTVLQVYAWMHAMWMELPTSFMDCAAGKGLLTVVKWLHTHSPAGCTSAAMDSAAGHGHLEVVQWLHANRSEGCTTHALNNAVDNGHLHMVQWLLEHYPQTSDLPEAIRHAAAFGQLDVLVWLTRAYPEEMCTRCVADSVLNGTLMSMGRVKSIDVLRWNDSQRVVLCASCRATAARHPCGAMISLSYEGDLEMCKYLYRFHREKLHFADPAKTVRRVAQAGHLGMLQWIDATFGGDDVDEMDRWDGDWTEAIKEAEKFGHDHILAWIRGVQATDEQV
jgi:hypothetical protein